MDAEKASTILEQADLIFDRAAIDKALSELATKINTELSGTDPVVFCAMNGALIPCGMLLPRLNFPFKIDYLHASRYQEKTSGSELQWIKKNSLSVKERVVLIIDDILDEGITLKSMSDFCVNQGASRVYTAVLAHKIHNRGNDFKADFVGLELVDRYVFGMGMDYKGYLRNLPAIYAVRHL